MFIISSFQHNSPSKILESTNSMKQRCSKAKEQKGMRTKMLPFILFLQSVLDGNIDFSQILPFSHYNGLVQVFFAVQLSSISTYHSQHYLPFKWSISTMNRTHELLYAHLTKHFLLFLSIFKQCCEINMTIIKLNKLKTRDFQQFI